MPHVSRYKLDKKTEEELIKNLKIVFGKIVKPEEITMLFSSLFSSTEQLMFAKRLAIVVLLNEKIPESQIADILHVTRVTVEKMRLFLETRGEGFNIALKKLEEEKMLQEFKKFLIKLARYSIRAAGGYVKPTILD